MIQGKAECSSRWSGRRWAVLAVAAMAVAGAASANPSTRCWTVTPGLDKCRVEEPEVKRASTDYTAVRFRPLDRVTITAGGCVQTGGSGKTWKRYVNPAGANSDRLYHGLIQIPGVHGSLVRFLNVNNTTVSVPANVNGFLRLGYEDDGYGDNGYWGHDDGNYDQCKNVGAAWVKLTIQHTCTAGQTLCNGVTCVSTGTDSSNCGACGVVCPSGQSCQAGRCACIAPTTSCGGRCVNTATDAANCGTCGKACGANQACQAATCACAAGFTSCDGQCVNLQTDPRYCGSCSRACAAGQTCQAGVCH